MQSKLLFLVTFIIFYSFSNAQTGSPAVQSTDTLCFCNEKVTMNGKPLKYREMKSVLTKYPAPATEFKKYMTKASIGTMALLTGVTSGIIALARIKKEEEFFNKYTITLFAGTLVGIPVILSSRKHLRKSVRLYNSQVLR